MSISDLIITTINCAVYYFYKNDSRNCQTDRAQIWRNLQNIPDSCQVINKLLFS